MALPSKELPEQALDALIARERTRVVAPLTEWHTLATSLRQEGLLGGSGASSRSAGARKSAPRPEYSATPTPRGPGWLRTTGMWSRRIVVSAALVGIGMVVGRGSTLTPDFIHQLEMIAADSVHGHSVTVGSSHITSPADARKVMLRSQVDYERASAFLAATDSGPQVLGEPDLYRDRLAGLDEMTAASLSALKAAPRDPLLSQYFLSATAAREATIRQLGNVLPVGATVARF